MQSRVVRITLVVAALGLLSAACGDKNEVGSGLEADGKGQGGSGAIGQAAITTLAPTTTAAPTVTTAKPVATTVVVPTAIFKIQDDTKGQYIEPLSNAVRAGSLVRFVNEDDTPHTITGKMGGQVVMGPSPSIAPGGTWDVKPTVKGTYDIVDEARPYAAGVTLTVG